MSCYICDKAIDEPKLDPRDMKTCPCSECESVIQDCIDGYPKLGDEPEDSDLHVYIDPDIEDYREYLFERRDYYDV